MTTIEDALAVAVSHHQAGRIDEAAGICRRIVASHPANAEGWFLLGAIEDELGNWEQSTLCTRQALRLRPGHAEAEYNLGISLYKQGKHSEAIECFREAVRLRPHFAEAHYSLGYALDERGNWREAVDCYRRAIDLKPDYSDAHWNLSLLLLLSGDFVRGFAEYEWRTRIDQTQPREFRQPKWRGEPLEAKTILLHAEQGFGDTLQFIRYATLVKDLVGNVIVECQKPLIRLLSNCLAIDRVVAAGEAMPEFDVHAPLLSLPGIVGTTLESIPGKGPYLFADEALVVQWREALTGVAGFRIGINWRGRADKSESRKRDVPLALMASLAAIPGVQLISVQRGPGQEDLKGAGARLPVIDLGEFDTEHGSFMDTAAIMKNVDLMISSDTAVPHLAGALGIPVWVALPFVPDWRWLLDRSDSPWYPTMRLFRQKKAGDWAGVFREIETALRQLV
jgi:hypothetical protein